MRYVKLFHGKKIIKLNLCIIAQAYQYLDTAGAIAVEAFEIYGNNYLMVANHYNEFDDVFFGYITTSTIYFWDNSVANGPLYVPIQSVETYGASDIEVFRIDDAYFLAIANYYNGTSYNLLSPVFRFRYEADMLGMGTVEVSVPFLDLVQEISTVGCRSIRYATVSSQHFLIVSNEQSHSINVYAWNNTEFIRQGDFAWESPVRIEILNLGFMVHGNPALLISVASRGNSSALLCLSASGEMKLVEALPAGPTSQIVPFHYERADYLALVLTPSRLVSDGGIAIYKLLLTDLAAGTALRCQLLTVQASNLVGALIYYTGVSSNDGILLAGSGWGGSINATTLGSVSISRQASRVGISALDEQTIVESPDDSDELFLRDPVIYNQSFSNLFAQIKNFEGIPVFSPKDSSVSRGLCFMQQVSEEKSNLHTYESSVWAALNNYGSASLDHITSFPLPCQSVLLSASAPGLEAQILRLYSSSGWGIPGTLRFAVNISIDQARNLSAIILGNLNTARQPDLIFFDGSLSLNGSQYFLDVLYSGQLRISVLATSNSLSSLNISFSGLSAIQSGPGNFVLVAPRPPKGSYLTVRSISDSQPVSLRGFSVLLESRECSGRSIPFPTEGQTIAATLTYNATQISLRNFFATASDGVVIFTDLTVIGGGIDIQIEFSCLTDCGLSPAVIKLNVSEAIFQKMGPDPTLDFWEGSSMSILSSGTILIYGGYAPGTQSPTHRLEILDPGGIDFVTLSPDWRATRISEGSWTPPPRSHHAACAINTSLFVHGGYGTTDLMSGLYEFQYTQRVWINLSNIAGEPSPRADHIMASLDKHIVVYGGMNASGCFDMQVYLFSLDSKSWSKVSPPSSFSPQVSACPFSMTTAGSKVYLCQSANSFYILDIVSQLWKLCGSSASEAYRVSSNSPTLWTFVRLDDSSGGTPRILSILKQQNYDPNSYGQIPNRSNTSQTYPISIFELETSGTRRTPIHEIALFRMNLSLVSGGVTLAEGRVVVFGIENSKQNKTKISIISTDPRFALAFDDDAERASTSLVMAHIPIDPPFVVWAVDSIGMQARWSPRLFVVQAFAYGLDEDAVPLDSALAIATEANEKEAIFTDLKILSSSAGLVLVFKSAGLLSVATSPFNVIAGPSWAVKSDRDPQGIVPGAAFLIQPSVQIIDVDGNNVWTDSFSVVQTFLQYFSISHSAWINATEGSSGSGLDGNIVAVAKNSRVEWTDLAINLGSAANADVSGDLTSPMFRLIFRRSGFDDAFSSTFTYSQASDKALNVLFLVEPPDYFPVVTSDGSIPTLVVEVVLNRFPDVLFAGDNTTEIVASLVPPDSGPTAGRLIGTMQKKAVFGRATFTDLTVDLAADGYRIRFSAANFPVPALSQYFDVVAAAASYLIIEAVGGGGNSQGGFAAGGEPFWTQPVILAKDEAGNPTSSPGSFVVSANLLPDGANISLLVADSNISAGQFIPAPILKSDVVALSGHVSILISSDARAKFYDLTVNRAGDYMLVFTASLPSIRIVAVSQPLKIRTGLARVLTIFVQPESAYGGIPFDVQPIVGAVDFGGNIIYNTSDFILAAATIPMQYSAEWSKLHSIQGTENIGFSLVSSVAFLNSKASYGFIDSVGNVLVAVIHGGGNTDGPSSASIFRFVNGILSASINLASTGISDFAHFKAGLRSSQPQITKDFLVAVCHFNDQSGYLAETQVFQIESNISGELKLSKFQSLQTFGAVSVTSFEAAGNVFVVIACQGDGSGPTKVSA